MVEIYSKEDCIWCLRAKRLAERYALDYREIDVTDLPNLSELKSRVPDVKTVPQIFWHGRHIGGYEQFASEIENTLGNYGQETP
jgi:glutaredoxin 3